MDGLALNLAGVRSCWSIDDSTPRFSLLPLVRLEFGLLSLAAGHDVVGVRRVELDRGGEPEGCDAIDGLFEEARSWETITTAQG